MKTRIRKHEIGLRFRHGDFVRLVDPGGVWLPGKLFAGNRDRVEVISTLDTKFEHKLLDLLVREPSVAEKLLVVDLQDTQRALVWKDGRLAWVLGTGRHAFWKSPYDLEVETYDVEQFTFTHPKIEAILGFRGGGSYLDGVRVESHERVLLFREGQLVDQLKPGLHVYWKHTGKVVWKAVDLRQRSLDVSGQEIMTADKVSLRVNLFVSFRVDDAATAVSSVDDYEQALYREAQLALREAVGGRTLDKLLSDKDAVGREVRDAIAAKAALFGVTVSGVGLRDVILPGDMKTILNEVILAQKQAEANLIRRREETAAARSQANTAKLLADNPVLARMKELEALQNILKGANTTFLFGQGDMLGQVRTLTDTPDDNPGCALSELAEPGEV
ncbi:MAG: slipin family protein [Planctomycetota bacterium]